jgi:hypothetical protein
MDFSFSGIEIIVFVFGIAALAVFFGFVIIAEKRLREQRKDVVGKLEKKFKEQIDD